MRDRMYGRYMLQHQIIIKLYISKFNLGHTILQ